MTPLAKKLKRAVFGPRWTVIRTIWPYKEGWGVWNPSTRTVLETGIPKEMAQAIADQENAREESQ